MSGSLSVVSFEGELNAIVQEVSHYCALVHVLYFVK